MLLLGGNIGEFYTTLFIRVNIYQETVYTNRLFRPRLEVVTTCSSASIVNFEHVITGRNFSVLQINPFKYNVEIWRNIIYSTFGHFSTSCMTWLSIDKKFTIKLN